MKTFLSAPLALLALTSCVGWRGVSGCTLTKAPKKYSMEYTLYNADVVIIGRDVFHEPPRVLLPPEYVDTGENYAIFTVDCVLKSAGHTIGRNITVLEGAVRPSCSGTTPKVGSRYILALEVADISNQTYYIYEPNTLNPGGFRPIDENLNAAITVCGLDERQALDGAPDGACPAVRAAATAEDCVKQTAADAALESAVLSTLTLLVCLVLSSVTL